MTHTRSNLGPLTNLIPERMKPITIEVLVSQRVAAAMASFKTNRYTRLRDGTRGKIS